MKLVNAIVITLLLAGLGTPGSAGAVFYYEYETDEGVLSFTDDARRIPEKYKADAERKVARPLFDYARATIVEKGASTASAETIFGRELLEGEGTVMRHRDDIDWSFASRPKPEPAPRSSTRLDLEVADGVRLGIDTNGDEPIYIEHKQYTDKDGDYITSRDGIVGPRTVVRQGDRDLVYIEDRAR